MTGTASAFGTAASAATRDSPASRYEIFECELSMTSSFGSSVCTHGRGCRLSPVRAPVENRLNRCYPRPSSRKAAHGVPDPRPARGSQRGAFGAARRPEAARAARCAAPARERVVSTAASSTSSGASDRRPRPRSSSRATSTRCASTSAATPSIPQAHGYRLRLDPHTLDLLEFERLTEEARTVALEEAVELRRRALALWRGPPLADVVFEGHARHEVGRLSELHLTTQLERIEAELELGRHAQLIGELESLVAAHPYQERLHAQLMLALYRSGRQTEALQAYQAVRSVLSDELGLQPGQALRELEAAILRQDERSPGRRLELRRRRPTPAELPTPRQPRTSSGPSPCSSRTSSARRRSVSGSPRTR